MLNGTVFEGYFLFDGERLLDARVETPEFTLASTVRTKLP